MSKRLVDYKDLYETLHFHELESRERVFGRLQVSLGLVVALAGGIAFLFEGFDMHGSGFAFVVFTLLLLTSTGCLLWAAYHLRQVFWGNTYKEMTSAKEVREHEDKLHDYYYVDPSSTETPPDAGQKFKAHFEGFLIEKFVNTATHNAQVNDSRAEHLHRANRAILLTVASSFIAYIVFILGGLHSDSPPEVRVVGTTEVAISPSSSCTTAQLLTCDQLRAQICGNPSTARNDVSTPANERQQEPRSATATSASTSVGTLSQVPSGASNGASGQRRMAEGSALVPGVIRDQQKRQQPKTTTSAAGTATPAAPATEGAADQRGCRPPAAATD